MILAKLSFVTEILQWVQYFLNDILGVFLQRYSAWLASITPV
jgi:hypothetical protein